jgi:hypothetical protein
MDGTGSSTGEDGGGALRDGVAPSAAARYIARERQKEDLRRERDHLVVDLARDLGEQGLSESLGVTPRVVGDLLAGARARLEARARSASGPEITARRLRGGRPDRWADADDLYEALGRRSARRGRR